MSSQVLVRLIAGIALFLFAAPGLRAAIPDSERQALIDFFNSTNGPGWIQSTNWNGPARTECTWLGITCDSSETHVTAISFPGGNEFSFGLSGTLPPSIAVLSALESLDLTLNAVSGPLPDLSSLTALKTLAISFNGFTGPLPDLHAFANLEGFAASTNQFTGALPPLDGLDHLTVLDVSRNQLSGSIPPLADLGSIQYIDISDNAFSGSIPPIADLHALASFDVSSNHLQGSLPALDDLPSLGRFRASDNALTGTIPSLTGAPMLESFEVGQNFLSGSIPELDGLADLTVFSADDNALSGPLPTFDGMSHLYLFSVRDNQLSGPVPSLVDLTGLVGIQLGYNSFDGPMPGPPAAQLSPGSSSLCPNRIAPETNAVWDAATGSTPWYATCTPAPQNITQFGLTGSWYNPLAPGQGVLIDSIPDTDGSGGSTLFAGWFTFTNSADDSPENQRWYSLQGHATADAASALLGVYTTDAGIFADPPSVPATLTGHARITFEDCTHATFTASALNEQPGDVTSMPLTRLTSNTSCGPNGDNGASASNNLLSGAWYDPATSGQGLLFDISVPGHTLFAGWYTYVPASNNSTERHRWYTLQFDELPDGATHVEHVPIYSTTGGIQGGSTPDLETTRVGYADLAFASCTSLSMSYAFDRGENEGLAATLELARVGAAPEDCPYR